MYVRDLIVGLFRRWYLVLAGLAATTALTFGVLSVVPVDYHAEASVLLLPPRTSLGKNGNPYLYLGGLNQAMGILSTRMNAADYQAQLKQAFPGATLEIAPDATTTGPILSMTGTSSSPQEALQIMRTGLTAADPALQTLQDELQIPASSRIGVMTLNADSSAERDTKNQVRAGVAISGVGLAGTLLLTALIDGWLLERRRPRVLSLRWWRRSERSAGKGDWDWWAEEQARPEKVVGEPDRPVAPADASSREREDVVVGERRD